MSEINRKEFKSAMIRGLGRCVIAVRQDPEKYRDIVLWACKRNYAYDAQSEGTRSWYTYTLASAYPDRETFIHATAEALKKYRPKGGWDLLHLCEVLMFFAMDGYESARKAVEEKYREILGAMFARKRRPTGVVHELSDLEQLGLVLAVDRASFLRIAGDFGRLYREKAYLLDGDFDWFFSSKGGQFPKTLERAAKKDPDIACFLERERANVRAREEQWERRRADPERARKGILLSRWLAKKADSETVERYALAYRDQKDPELRAKALHAFSLCPYPLDPQPILEDAWSAHELLCRNAWTALENLRHPAVREFAWKNVDDGVRTAENFALLAKNYLPKDAERMEQLLRELIDAGDRDGIHRAGMAVYRAHDDDPKAPYPKHLLPLLYEHNPCSFCRASALRFMSGHRMLTREILEECRFDSDYDIRVMATRRLKRL